MYYLKGYNTYVYNVTVFVISWYESIMPLIADEVIFGSTNVDMSDVLEYRRKYVKSQERFIVS